MGQKLASQPYIMSPRAVLTHSIHKSGLGLVQIDICDNASFRGSQETELGEVSKYPLHPKHPIDEVNLILHRHN
jgi:hypothetical protein